MHKTHVSRCQLRQIVNRVDIQSTVRRCLFLPNVRQRNEIRRNGASVGINRY